MYIFVFPLIDRWYIAVPALLILVVFGARAIYKRLVRKLGGGE
jgi:hypothetical protein